MVSFTGTASDPEGDTPLSFYWDFSGGAFDSVEEDPGLVHAILLEGSERARDEARETIEDVRSAIGLTS